MLDRFYKYYITRFLGFVVWFELVIQIPLNSLLAYYLLGIKKLGINWIFFASELSLCILLYLLRIYFALKRVFFKSYNHIKITPLFPKIPFKLLLSTFVRLYIESIIIPAVYICGVYLCFAFLGITTKNYFPILALVFFGIIALIIHGYIIHKVVKDHAEVSYKK